MDVSPEHSKRNRLVFVGKYVLRNVVSCADVLLAIPFPLPPLEPCTATIGQYGKGSEGAVLYGGRWIFEKNSRATTTGQSQFSTLSCFFSFFQRSSRLFGVYQGKFPRIFCLKLRGFPSKRRKANKENKKKVTKPFYMLVVAHLSSSEDLS